MSDSRSDFVGKRGVGRRGENALPGPHASGSLDGMKMLLRFTLVILVAALTGTARAAEFSETLSRADFAAAGLEKLSPAELARLDELVRTLRSGEVDQARADEAAKVRAEIVKEKPSLLGRMKVKLTPGTEIDYEAIETMLVGSFRGYQKGTILRLANGQRWKVVDGRFWAPKKEEDKPRKVRVEPGMLGSFFLDIEDGGRPKVSFVGTFEQ